jgi:omega-6 fatty acid desaturase (delta-12 desaturase)
MVKILEKSNDIQSRINKKLSRFEFKNEFVSFYYLLRDIIFNIISFVIFYNFIGIDNNIFQYTFYSIIQGTLMTSLWVLAHECGHYAFSNKKTINNIIGYILHIFLLVPYFAWQYSHKKHHKYTNHLILGESFVPQLYNDNILINILSEDVFSIVNVILRLFGGWTTYLLTNETGGKVQYDLKTPINSYTNKSHFGINSQIFPPSMNRYLLIDSIGILCLIIFLIYNNLIILYIGPYLIVNSWLVLYTWLQHTHEDIPHYGLDEFTFLRGALSTIDRNYPELINNIHHDIGFTHVLHHINSRCPHYYSREALNEIMPIIKNYYRKDNNNIITSLLNISKHCNYVDNLDGIQYYKSFF